MSSIIVELENEIKKIQEDMKQIHTELSILTEFYAETRELLTELSQLSKKTELLEQPRSLLEFDSVSSNSNSSKLDRMIQKCIDSIIRDYRDQYKER